MKKSLKEKITLESKDSSDTKEVSSIYFKNSLKLTAFF